MGKKHGEIIIVTENENALDMYMLIVYYTIVVGFTTTYAINACHH